MDAAEHHVNMCKNNMQVIQSGFFSLWCLCVLKQGCSSLNFRTTTSSLIFTKAVFHLKLFPK